MRKLLLAATLVIFAIFLAIFILHRKTKPEGLIAFVIDDWGYSNKNISLLLEIERPITLSVLPNLRYSTYIAEKIKNDSKVHDVILHLPLESDSDKAAEASTIRCGMQEKEIISILDKDISGVPGLIGVSNHQGSKATQDKRVMKIILGELKKRKLFFLDSVTTPDSVCADISRDAKIKFAERDVFLDITDQSDPANLGSYVKKQIKELGDIAKRNGSAIGIGHNERITLETIKNAIPELEKEGLKIVPLKTLVR